MQHAALVHELRETIERTLRPLLAGARAVALLDHPNHWNVGDSAIWLGETAFLRGLGIRRPAYAADRYTCSEETLRRRIGDGPILLSGGGNLGDLWGDHQALRERIVRAFPDNPIVQLPQSIHFRERSNLERARAVFDAHPRLVLLVRDTRSLEIAQNEFRARALLCPDMALYLGALERPVQPSRDVLVLLRSDHESRLGRTPRPAAREGPVDWRQEERTLGVRLQEALREPLVRGARDPGWRWRALAATYEPVARGRLRRALGSLASARRVVTDRLHGHILCLQLGIPHVLVDNSYGKLRAFHETWTKGSDLVTWCETHEQALTEAGR